MRLNSNTPKEKTEIPNRGFRFFSAAKAKCEADRKKQSEAKQQNTKNARLYGQKEKCAVKYYECLCTKCLKDFALKNIQNA